MLDSHDTIKLIDFGLSAEESCDNFSSSFLGSLEYVCPEIVQRKPYINCKAEVFSLGVLLYALLFGQFPFSVEDREMEDCTLVFSDSVNVSRETKEFLKHLLAFNPSKRYSLEDILSHPWLA